MSFIKTFKTDTAKEMNTVVVVVKAVVKKTLTGYKIIKGEDRKLGSQELRRK